MNHWIEKAKPFDLLDKYGSPLYVYSQAQIEGQVSLLQRLLHELDTKICYAVKANSNLSILALMKSCGCGFDIVSEGELRRVLRIGGKPSDIVFAGVGKTQEELEYALRSGVGMINVESPSELEALAELATRLGVETRISLRINPDIDVKTHPYLSTGLYENKFGIPIGDAAALSNTIKSCKLLTLVGVDCHIGSHVVDPTPLLSAYSQVIELGKYFQSQGAPIECVDFGGGFAVGYKPGEQVLDMQNLAKELVKLVAPSGFKLIIEPGKFLTAEAGVLLTKVLYKKHNGEKEFLIVDAGMNDLIRPPLYQAHHEIITFHKNSQSASRTDGSVNVVGPVCETGCFFAKERLLPFTEEDDILGILNAGAYCFTMASSYNSRRLPAEILILPNGESKLIGERQSYEDLWAREEFALA